MERRRLYVGIDVACAKVDVAFIDDQQRAVRPVAAYANQPSGWTKLADDIVTAAARMGDLVDVVCGMESTSNMHKRLEQALRNESRLRLDVHVLNPREIRYFAKLMLKDSKTDKLDSILIAKFLLRMQPETQVVLGAGIEDLRDGTRSRRRYVEERTAAKNALHRLLRYHFPGYRQVFRQFSTSVLTVLAEHGSPHLMLEAGIEGLMGITFGARGRKISPDLAQKLHELAAQAPCRVLGKIPHKLIETTARRILELDVLLDELDAILEETLDELFPDQVLTSIPGIGKVTAAAILAEVGHISRFETKVDFVGYCGLYPIVWQSGTSKQQYRMTYKGNRMLKLTFLVASASARRYNPLISSFYERLRARGKTKKAAGGAIARKLAELAFAVLVRNEPWSDDKAALAVAKGEAMASARAR